MTLPGQPASNTARPGRPGRVPIRRVAAFGLLIAVAAVIVVTTVFTLPERLVPNSQVADAATRIELQNSVRTTLLQGTAGLFLLVGAYLTWRQLQLGREQLHQTLQTATAQLQLTHEAQLMERFSKALEHLGHEQASVRAGAVYALEQSAYTSAEMRPVVHELLAAYVRVASTWHHYDPVTGRAAAPPDDSDYLDLLWLKIRSPDVQAAITVLGRRIEIAGEQIELEGVDLRHSYLGEANLHRAKLGRAMVAAAECRGANLSNTWCRNASFHRANLSGANLRHAVLRDADLRGTNLSDADVTDADLLGAVSDHATVWPAGFDWRAAGATLDGEHQPT